MCILCNIHQRHPFLPLHRALTVLRNFHILQDIFRVFKMRVDKVEMIHTRCSQPTMEIHDDESLLENYNRSARRAS